MQKTDYNFNPKNLMMDEAGANFNGVKNVLGQKFVHNLPMALYEEHERA